MERDKKINIILNIAFWIEVLIAAAFFLYATLSKNFIKLDNPMFGDMILNRNNILSFLSFTAMVVFALATLFFTILFTPKDISHYNLFIFIVLSAVWIFTSEKVPAVIFKYSNIYEMLLIFTFCLSPVAFVLYIKELCNYGKGTFSILIALLLALNLFGFIWIITHNGQSPNILYLFHILIMGIIGFSFFVCIRHFIMKKDFNSKILLTGISIFLATCLIAIIKYYINKKTDYSLVLSLGLLIFVASLLISAIKKFLDDIAIVKNFNNIASAIPCGIFKAQYDDKMTLLYGNDFYYGLFGYNTNDSKEEFVSACAPFPDKIKLITACREKIGSGIYNYEFDALARDKKGQSKDLLLNIQYLPDTNEIIGTVFDSTKRKEYEKQLLIAEEEYQIVSRHITHVVCRYDMNTKKLTLPENFAERFGLPLDAHIISDYKGFNSLINESSLDDFISLYSELTEGKKRGGAVLKLNEKNGDISWWDVVFDTIYDTNDMPQLAVVICQDITELREKDLAYQRWKQEIASIPKEKMYLIEWNLTKDISDGEQGGISECKLGDKCYISFDEKMFNYAQENVYVADRQIFIQKTNKKFLLDQYSFGYNSYNFEYREISAGNKEKWMSFNIQLVPDPHTKDIKGYFLIRDVDNEKKETLDLKYRANKDVLTGLLNRESFKERFERIVSEDDMIKYLLIIDVDNFKLINDSHGHLVGDNLLVKIAGILISLQEKGEYVGRLGGDEFVMLLKNITSLSELANRLDLILNKLTINVKGSVVTSSIGVAAYPENGNNFDTLYEKADIALYKAKRRGRNCYSMTNQ
ncbi:diguanylate cyclase [bacterium]|nr:diguanylate cyclase [bacterium]